MTDKTSTAKNADARIAQAPDAMRRTPQQLRSRRMVNAIVDSVRQILEEGGRESLSTTTLEVVSGVSKASIYQYFPNLDAVVAEVFHDVIRRRLVQWGALQLATDITVSEVVTLVVDSTLALHEELLDLDPEFYSSYSGFYDLWQAFDETQQRENASMLFLKHSMERCMDFPADGDARLFAFALGRSVELTTCAMLRDDPSFVHHAKFRDMLMRIGSAVVAL